MKATTLALAGALLALTVGAASAKTVKTDLSCSVNDLNSPATACDTFRGVNDSNTFTTVDHFGVDGDDWVLVGKLDQATNGTATNGAFTISDHAGSNLTENALATILAGAGYEKLVFTVKSGGGGASGGGYAAYLLEDGTSSFTLTNWSDKGISHYSLYGVLSTAETPAVPVPASIVLMGACGLSLGALKRLSRKKA